MDRLSIPEEIEFIAPMGNFNNHTPNEEEYLVYHPEDNTYRLPEAMMDTPIDEIYFLVNMNKNIHIASLPTNEYNVWANLGNVITDGNETIVFRPDEYRRGEPEYKISGNVADSIHNHIVNNLKRIAIEASNTIFRLMQENDEFDIVLAQRDSLNNEISELKNQVPEKYHWLFLEIEFIIINNYHPTYLEMVFHSRKENRQMLDKIRRSISYYNYMLEKTSAAKNLIDNSPFIPLSLYSSFNNIDIEIILNSLSEDANIPAGYFSNYLNNVLATSDDHQICGTILFDRAQNMSYRIEEKAIELINRIKEDYPDYKGLHNGNVEQFLQRFKIKEGIAAPDFTIATLCGENFNLSDHKGKFVFIDFWGTWCGPCVGEVPHLIELANSIPEDELIIIGLSVGDTEEKLNTFIAENGINYRNAMCSDDIQKEYGVNSFPTTFLIDKEGNIVAKNLRGNLLAQLKTYMN